MPTGTLANVWGVFSDDPAYSSKCIVAPDGEEDTEIAPAFPEVTGG